MLKSVDKYIPVTITLLIESTVILLPILAPLPEILVAHIPNPLLSYFTTKQSPLTPVNDNVPKIVPSELYIVVVEEYWPVTIISLFESTYIDSPISLPLPDICVAHP